MYKDCDGKAKPAPRSSTISFIIMASLSLTSTHPLYSFVFVKHLTRISIELSENLSIRTITGVDGVILGCTELSLVALPSNVKFIDPLDILADSVIKIWQDLTNKLELENI